jgi:hypothetical protein
MTPEGMVHALNEIHRILAPNGCMIDIHPFAEPLLVEVYLGSRVLFSEPQPDFSAESFLEADKALKDMVRRGTFSLGQRGHFDYLVCASSTTELNDYHNLQGAFGREPGEEICTPQEVEQLTRIDAIMHNAGAGVEVATHEKIHITRLLPIK